MASTIAVWGDKALYALLSQHSVPGEDVGFVEIYKDTPVPYPCVDAVICTEENALVEIKHMQCGQGGDGKKLPVFFVSKGQEKQEPEYEEGIVIYKVPRPLHLEKLFGLLRRCIQKKNDTPVTIAIGRFMFCPATHTLHYGEKSVTLTDKETAIIQHLQATKKPVSKKELLTKVWGYGKHLDTHTVETHIYRLRQKIGETEEFIITDIEGYRLCHTKQ